MKLADLFPLSLTFFFFLLFIIGPPADLTDTGAFEVKATICFILFESYDLTQNISFYLQKAHRLVIKLPCEMHKERNRFCWDNILLFETAYHCGDTMLHITWHIISGILSCLQTCVDLLLMLWQRSCVKSWQLGFYFDKKKRRQLSPCSYNTARH